MTEAEEYLVQKGWEVRSKETIKGGVNLILDCPICGAETKKGKRRFYIVRSTGVWITNCCGESGNIYTLKKRLGDLQPISSFAHGSTGSTGEVALAAPQPPDNLRDNEGIIDEWHAALLADETAMDWVTKHRSIPIEMIEKFRLGLRFKGGRRWLTIPYLADGRPVLLKYRSMEGSKAFERMSGCPSPLFNLDSLKGEWKRVFVTEGELDAVSLETFGFSPAVSLPSGAGSITLEHAAWLERFDEVYVVTDMDHQGQQAADKIAERLGAYRCLRVSLPLKDSNACLQAGMVDDVRKAVEDAAAMGQGSVSRLVDLLESALDSGKALDKGSSTGLSDLDNVIGGFRAGEWTVVSGDTGVGKTQLQFTMCTNQIKGGKGVLVCSPELSPEAVAIRWCSQIVGKSFHIMSADEKRDALTTIGNMGPSALVVPRQGTITVDELGGMVEFCARRYGISMVSFDHLDFMLNDINDLRTIDSGILAFNNLCAKFAVHGLLGVHPKSINTHDGKGKGPRKVRMGDLRGSSKIKQLAHNIVVLDPPDQRTGISVLRVEKKRWEGNTTAIPASVPIEFIKDSLTYVNATSRSFQKFDTRMAASGERLEDWSQ